MKPKILQIEWEDACSCGNGWLDMSEVSNNLLKVTSIGYIFMEDDKAITLVADVPHEGERVGRDITIPKSCITKKRILKLK